MLWSYFVLKWIRLGRRHWPSLGSTFTLLRHLGSYCHSFLRYIHTYTLHKYLHIFRYENISPLDLCKSKAFNWIGVQNIPIYCWVDMHFFQRNSIVYVTTYIYILLFFVKIITYCLNCISLIKFFWLKAISSRPRKKTWGRQPIRLSRQEILENISKTQKINEAFYQVNRSNFLMLPFYVCQCSLRSNVRCLQVNGGPTLTELQNLRSQC